MITYPRYSIWSAHGDIGQVYEIVRWHDMKTCEIVQTNIRTYEKAHQALADWRKRAAALEGDPMPKLNTVTKPDPEAFELLNLIHAEFSSDPASVACFDLRIVERVKAWVEKHSHVR